MSGDLAAVVPTDHVDACLRAFETREVYDADRRLENLGEGRVAIPITRPVAHPAVERVETGLADRRRLRTLADHLEARGWTDGELAQAPGSYARIGDVVLLDGWPPRRPDDVGEALLDLHGESTTVLARLDIEGDRRKPAIAHVAGEARTTTVHREHGIRYGLDLTDVMFSPGNQAERVRMGRVIDPGEHVVDLCAGIGYFTLPMAAAGARVTAVERNPAAYRWLTANASRNGLDERIVAVRGDCRGVTVRANRAVIGHLPVHDCREDEDRFGGGYLDAAIHAVGENGWLHVHGLAYDGDHDAASHALRQRLADRKVNPETVTVRQVKSVAPRTDHLVFDVRIHPATG